MRSRLWAIPSASILLLNVVPGFGQEPEAVGHVVGGVRAEVDWERAKAMGLTLDYDAGPRLVRQTTPDYPKAAQKKGIEGTVVVEMVIDRRGRVSHTRVLQSVPGLDSAALKCVKGWTFKPATKGGQAVATLAQAPVTFQLSGKPRD